MTLSTLPIHPSLTHPRTGLALEAIGMKRNGDPIWPVMGGDGTDEDPWKATFGDKTPEQVQKDIDDLTAKAASGDGDSEWTKTFADLTPEKVKEALDNSRKWEDRAKGNKGKADQLDTLVAAITGGNTDDKPDPDKLASDLSASQSETRATQVENAILKKALSQSADGVRLTDSRAFMSSVSSLDPKADDFGSKVDEAIKKAIEGDPSLKLNATTGPRPARQQGQPSEGQQQGSVKTGAQRYAERHAKKA